MSEVDSRVPAGPAASDLNDGSFHWRQTWRRPAPISNFAGTTEAAFTFYKSIFGTEFVGDVARMGDNPPFPGQPELSDEDKQLVMNVQLPILGGHLLMGTDATASMGMTVN